MKVKNANKVIQVLRRFSFNHWGAGEQCAWQSAKLMRKAGIACEIYATAALTGLGQEIKDQIAINRFNYFYPHVGLNQEHIELLDLKGGNPYSIGLTKAIYKSSSRLIHCHTNTRLAAGVRLISKAKKIPYIITLHGGQYCVPKSETQNLANFPTGFGGYGRLMDSVFKPTKVLKEASGIICPSYDEFIAVRKTFPLKPCLYLAGGVDAHHFLEPAQVDIRDEYGIDKRATLLLCSGRIDSQKNQKMLLDLMAALKTKQSHPYHLLLIGHLSNKDYYTSLTTKIEELELENLVTVIPGLRFDSNALLAAYQQSDILIIPSIHEPQGLPVLEGWVSRLPVLAAKTSGLAHLVEDEKNGLLFNPMCLTSLSGCLNKLMKDSHLRNQLIEAGYEKVMKHFQWQNYFEKLIAFYEEVEIFHAHKSSQSLTC